MQWTFHLETPLCFLALVVRTRSSASLRILHTAAPNTAPKSCHLEVKPHPVEGIYIFMEQTIPFTMMTLTFI